VGSSPTWGRKEKEGKEKEGRKGKKDKKQKKGWMILDRHIFIGEQTQKSKKGQEFIPPM
jgi:hypothetical protein